MSDDHRQKIANSAVLQHLIEHATGQRNMSTSAVTAAIALLRKVLPDLQSVQHNGDSDNPLTMIATIRREIVTKNGADA